MSTAITTIQVAASSDDAHCGDYNWPGQTWANATSKFIRLGYYMTTDYMYMAGFRFPSVPVPQGATIDSATITLYAHDMFQGSGSLVLTVAGEDVDDGATWSSSHTPYNAYGSKTTATVDWTVGTWTGGNWYASADIKTVIEEIVGRAGWASGNDLNLIIYPQDDAETNYRTLRMYDYSGNTYGAKLDITYTEASGGDIEATANLAAATADGLQATAENAPLSAEAGLASATADGLQATAELILDPSLYYAYQDALLTDAEGATVEADLQVTSSDTGQDRGGMIEACTGGAQYVLWIGQDGFNLHGQPRVLQDMTDRVHRFRLEARGGVCRVKVDDQLRQYGTAANATARQEAAAGSYPGAP